MKTAHLSWEEVAERAGGQVIDVHYDGIRRSGRCEEESMRRMFDGCELLQMTRTDYQVTRWPEGRTKLKDWRVHKNED